ncbi:hypothetical protein JHK85_008186 [Glycine max]|nr:hypothetical protein JHK85_008186 [Glycine max]
MQEEEEEEEVLHPSSYSIITTLNMDSNGRVLFSYAANIGSGSVVIAELWAILLRNKISWRLEPRVG